MTTVARVASRFARSRLSVHKVPPRLRYRRVASKIAHGQNLATANRIMTERTLLRGSLTAVILVAGAGCTSPLPRYDWHDAQTAFRIMTERESAIRTFSATCRILLESGNGRVQLTGALVAEPPDRLRLRAWKFSQTVLDITLNDDGLFVLQKGRSDDAKEKLEHVDHARFVEAISLMPGFERDAAWQAGREIDQDEFAITKPSSDDGPAIECIADKATLIRKRCLYRDDANRVRQSLSFDAYVHVDDTVWPMRVTGEGESGLFLLLFDRIDINAELAERAFVPPRRAVRQP